MQTKFVATALPKMSFWDRLVFLFRGTVNSPSIDFEDYLEEFNNRVCDSQQGTYTSFSGSDIKPVFVYDVDDDLSHDEVVGIYQDLELRKKHCFIPGNIQSISVKSTVIEVVENRGELHCINFGESLKVALSELSGSCYLMLVAATEYRDSSFIVFPKFEIESWEFDIDVDDIVLKETLTFTSQGFGCWKNGVTE